MNKEQEILLQTYKTVLPEVSHIGVYPNIEVTRKNNPYLSLLYKGFPLTVYSVPPLFPHFLLHPKTTIIHYNWVEANDMRGLIVLCIKLLPLFIFMLFGGKVVWTVHNSDPHRGNYLRFNRFIRILFARHCAKLFAHSEPAKEFIAQKLQVPLDKIQVIPHPIYPVTRITKEEASTIIKKILPDVPSGKTFLMYGHIAPYKGILEIVKLFKDMDSQLLIAGKIKDQGYFEEIQATCQNIHNVTLLPRYIEEYEEQALFSYVDAIIFNFKKILTSGSILLAGSYGTPIISRPVLTAIPDSFTIETFENDLECKAIIEEYNA